LQLAELQEQLCNFASAMLSTDLEQTADPDPDGLHATLFLAPDDDAQNVRPRSHSTADGALLASVSD
jgi:hypothetical protein